MPKVIKKDGDIIDIQNMLNNIDKAIEAENVLLQVKGDRLISSEYKTLREVYYNIYKARKINYSYYLYFPLENSHIEKRREFLENFKEKLLKKIHQGITGIHRSELEKFYKELDALKSLPYCLKNIEVVNSRLKLFQNRCTFSNKSGLSNLNRPLLGMFSIDYTKDDFPKKCSFIIPLGSAKESDINEKGEFKHDEIRIIIDEQEYKDLKNKCNSKEIYYLDTNTVKLSDGRYYIGKTDIPSFTPIISDDFLEEFHLDQVTSFKLDYLNKVQKELLQVVRDTFNKVGFKFWINFFKDTKKESKYIAAKKRGNNNGTGLRKQSFVGKRKRKFDDFVNSDSDTEVNDFLNQSDRNGGIFYTTHPRYDDMKMAKPINFVRASDNISHQRSSSSIQIFGAKRKFDNFANSDSDTKVNGFLTKADGDGRNFYTTQLGYKTINIAGASDINFNQRSKRIKNTKN